MDKYPITCEDVLEALLTTEACDGYCEGEKCWGNCNKCVARETIVDFVAQVRSVIEAANQSKGQVQD